HDGSGVLGLESGAVIRVGPAGVVAWRLAAAEQPLHSISASNVGVVYLAYESGGLRAVNYAGHPLWAVTVSEDFVHGPILDAEGRIYLVTEGYELLQLSPDGRTQMRYSLDRVPEHAVMRPDNTLVFAYEDGAIDVVDPQRGRETRMLEAESEVEALLVDEDGTVSVLFSNGDLGRIQQHDQSAEGYSIEILAREVAGAVSSGNGDYITTDRNGVVRRVDEDAEIRLTIRPGLVEGAVNDLSAPVIGRSGHVAVTDRRWALWSFSGIEVSEPSWRGQAAGGLRDGRIAVLEPPSRRDARNITQYRILSSLSTRGNVRETERVLEDIETALDRGDLLGRSSWISYVLIDIAGEGAGSPEAREGEVPSEIASRAYTALGRVGDRVAVRALQYAAENVEEVSQLESVVTAIAQSGYDFDSSRDVTIHRAFHRFGGAGEHSALEMTFIRAIETVWEQGGGVSPATVSQVAELQESGANRTVRDNATRLLRRLIFGSASSMLGVSLFPQAE
ncbi:MAG: hypothetical protein ACOCRN_04605, partial [Spirochaetia bacterium]